MNITNYLLIGVAVQVIVTALRYALGKWDPRDLIQNTFKDTLFCVICFLIGFISVGVCNVILWPLTIVTEIYNTIKGI